MIQFFRDDIYSSFYGKFPKLFQKIKSNTKISEYEISHNEILSKINIQSINNIWINKLKNLIVSKKNGIKEI